MANNKINKIEMIKVKELEGFNPKEFRVEPGFYGLNHERYYRLEPSLLEAVRAKAKAVDDVCVAIVHTDAADFVLAESSTRFHLFNAVKTTKSDGEMHAVNLNNGRGALTKYFFDRFVKYEPGEEL